MNININNLKPSMSFYYKNNLYLVINANHSKSGRGQARVKVKCKNWKTNAVVTLTFSGGSKINQAFVNKEKTTFQYFEGNQAIFINMSNYSLYEIEKNQIKEHLMFLVPGVDIEIISIDGEFLQINLPAKIQLKVIEAEPNVKGNTVAAAQKKVKIETGYEITVPLFINKNDVIIVDSQTKKYDGRK